MAHFAKLDENNLVVEVNVVNNDDIEDLPFPESEPVGIEFLKNWSGGHENWKQTSYNGNFRKNYASVGYLYDAVRDAFIPPQPYASWVLDEQSCQWTSPVPYPNDEKLYVWNEDSLSWVEMQNA